MAGKDEHQDCGAFAKYFQLGDNGAMSPFPKEMIEWEKVHHKDCNIFSLPTEDA